MPLLPGDLFHSNSGNEMGDPAVFMLPCTSSATVFITLHYRLPGFQRDHKPFEGKRHYLSLSLYSEEQRNKQQFINREKSSGPAILRDEHDTCYECVYMHHVLIKGYSGS